MPPATAERSSTAGLDSAELEKQAQEIANEGGQGDDGLGPIDPPAGKPVDPDPNSEANTGVPGGRQPGDDGYVGPTPEGEPPPLAAVADQPPTPPANLPDDAGDPDAEEEAPQLFVTGERQIGVKVGGRKPDSSVLKLKGGKIDLQGQFDRGDRFIAVATLQIVGDNDQDTIDKQSGEVKSTSKAQSATLCGFARIEEYIVDRIEDPALRNQVLEALDLELGGE